MKSYCMLIEEETIPIKTLTDKEQLKSYVKEKYPNWYCEEKENGERAIVSVKNGKITAIRNRNNQPTLHLYPELLNVKLPFETALLDTEIIVADKKGKSHFYNEKDEKGDIKVYGLQFRSRSIKDKKQMEKCPVSLVVFDVLKVDDELMINKPYSERYKKLLTISETELIKFSKNQSFDELWDKVVEDNREGVVLKNPNGFYEVDKRSKNLVKIKNYKVTDVVVEKTEKNEKGIKIIGKTKEGIDVECQFANVESAEIGSVVKIKYLDRIGNRLIIPTKITQ